MKTNRRIFILLLTLFTAGYATAAEQDIVGTWRGTLQVDPTTALTIYFTFARAADGKVSAVLNAPENASIKDVPAEAVSWRDGTLSMKVAALSGAYAGTLKGRNIEGQWTQEGKPLPLTLSPHEKMSKENLDTLIGTWNGQLAGTLTMVTRFRVNDKGELQGALRVIEQGATVPMSEIEFADSKLSFKIPMVQGRYSATYAKGVFTGAWHQPGMPPEGVPVVLKKGDYVARVYPLKLNAETYAALAGKWTGAIQVKLPDGKEMSVPQVVRFETNAQGQYVAYRDIPTANATGVPFTEASVVSGKVVLKAGGGEYQADLSGNTMTGKWVADKETLLLTLTRK